jgi:hypothetical protein
MNLTGGFALTPGAMAQGHVRHNSQAPGGMSKTYENYIRAKERQDSLAKDQVDRLNSIAINKVKHQKLAERQNRGIDEKRKENILKHSEMIKEARRKKD